jgi:DNA mismatch repair protein MutS
VPTPPIDAAQGGYIAEGYDDALDALRSTGGEGPPRDRGARGALPAADGIASLKIRHNGVLGYHVEVPAKNADRLMAADSGFTHRQTLAGVVRFNAPDLHEQAMRVGQAGAHALAAEAAHLEELTSEALNRANLLPPRRIRWPGSMSRQVSPSVPRKAAGRARCWSTIAASKWRAAATRSSRMRCGRAAAASSRTTAACRRRAPVAGHRPEHGRQIHLPAPERADRLLAQAGSFVPATQATLGLVDRLFSRVGAPTISPRPLHLHGRDGRDRRDPAQATPRSFVILDEVGRGTSTYDGSPSPGRWWRRSTTATAAAACSRPIITSSPASPSGSTRSPSTMSARASGRASSSSSTSSRRPRRPKLRLAVAKLAGLPPPVLSRARSVLAKLEEGRAATRGIAAGLDDLPLFAAAREAAEAAPDPLAAELAEVDADALSPREALELVYKLKRLASEQG